jgi:hypothetical protein
LPANVTQNTTGTKRIIAVNCGSGLDLTGYPFFYAPPFNSDNGFQGNEPATYLTSSTPTTATTSAIDRSGVVNPAPEAVYQSIRHHWSNPATISYSIPNIPSGNKTVRLHFAEIYYNLTGDQVFDIWLYHPQGSLVYDNFDILAQTGGVKNKAYVLDLLNVSHDGSIGVQLVPQLGWTGVYNAAISGIEILKP